MSFSADDRADHQSAPDSNASSSDQSISAAPLQSFSVSLFAAARERIGLDRILVDIALPSSSDAVLAAVSEQFPPLADMLGQCRLAVNLEYATSGQQILASDDVAIIPPVGGG
jgi:molybdopterin converting factor small subunit